jgi:hypothetical protein
VLLSFGCVGEPGAADRTQLKWACRVRVICAFSANVQIAKAVGSRPVDDHQSPKKLPLSRFGNTQ